MELRVADILRYKSGGVVTIGRTATVYETIAKMVEHNVGSILVTNAGEVCGIFTERDYLRRIVLQGRTSKTTRVEEVMTEDVIWVDPGFTVEECMATMTQKKCRHLPVIVDGELIGVISIGDCAKALSREAQARVQYLTSYITGQYPG